MGQCLPHSITVKELSLMEHKVLNDEMPSWRGLYFLFVCWLINHSSYQNFQKVALCEAPFLSATVPFVKRKPYG